MASLAASSFAYELGRTSQLSSREMQRRNTIKKEKGLCVLCVFMLSLRKLRNPARPHGDLWTLRRHLESVRRDKRLRPGVRHFVLIVEVFEQRMKLIAERHRRQQLLAAAAGKSGALGDRLLEL